MHFRTVCLFLLGAGLILVGGRSDGEEKTAAKAPQNRDYEEFTGRIEAIASVDLRPRVSGVIDKVLFRAGSIVNKGDVLFELDPRSHQAELKRLEAGVQRSEARVKRVTMDQLRFKRLLAQRAVSQEDYDRVQEDRADADATLQMARSDLRRCWIQPVGDQGNRRRSAERSADRC